MKVTNEPLPYLHEFLENSDFVLATLPQVIRELKGLKMNKHQKTARRAEKALSAIGTKVSLIENFDFFRTPEADVALTKYAVTTPGDILIATLDGKLLSDLESKMLPYLTLRNDRPFVRSFHRATYLSSKKH